MTDIKKYIETGILELYVMGMCTDSEIVEVEEIALIIPSIREEINAISDALEIYALADTLTPDPTIKPFLLAAVDYQERLMAGEQASFPPVITADSTVADFAEWLDRKDMKMPENFSQFHAKIIGYTATTITAITWLEHAVPGETHHDQYENFLVVEGTCDIFVEEEVQHLSPGSVFSIPLHKKHLVKVTSPFPCKVILQRIAA